MNATHDTDYLIGCTYLWGENYGYQEWVARTINRELNRKPA